MEFCLLLRFIIIGCGINMMDGTCFYTKNGHNLGIAFRGKRKKEIFKLAFFLVEILVSYFFLSSFLDILLFF